MFNGLQTLLIGSTFKERKQMIDQMKNNETKQSNLKFYFTKLELAKLAITDSEFYCGSNDSVQEWEEELEKWNIIKNKNNIEDLSKILDIPLPNPLQIGDLPVESKKILAGLLDSTSVNKWATSKKIISAPNSTEKYEELIAYHFLHGIAAPTNTQKLVTEISDLNLKFDKQLEMLEKIESLLERFLSKVEIMNKLDKAQDPEL